MLSSGMHAYAVDVAIAIDHITLMAVREGLGTCWIGSQVCCALDCGSSERTDRKGEGALYVHLRASQGGIWHKCGISSRRRMPVASSHGRAGLLIRQCCD